MKINKTNYFVSSSANFISFWYDYGNPQPQSYGQDLSFCTREDGDDPRQCRHHGDHNTWHFFLRKYLTITRVLVRNHSFSFNCLFPCSLCISLGTVFFLLQCCAVEPMFALLMRYGEIVQWPLFPRTFLWKMTENGPTILNGEKQY